MKESERLKRNENRRKYYKQHKAESDAQHKRYVASHREAVKKYSKEWEKEQGT